VIFEVNMRLFRGDHQSGKKLLLFILRDFDERTNNREVIRHILEADIEHIWTEIYKEPHLQGASARDFFDFAFQFMPHMIFEADAFTQHCGELRSRFSTENNANWFAGHEGYRVPMDGLPLFVDKTWEKIRTQKELNLPDQRVMVATLRCGELKDEAIEKVQPLIQSLRERADQERLESFAQECRHILGVAGAHYDEYGRHYDHQVYLKVRRDLLQATIMQQSLFLCFDSQLKLLRHTVFERFDRDLRRHLKGGDVVNEDFWGTSERLFADALHIFVSLSSQLLFEAAAEDWVDQISMH
jgi:protein SEY1